MLLVLITSCSNDSKEFSNEAEITTSSDERYISNYSLKQMLRRPGTLWRQWSSRATSAYSFSNSYMHYGKCSARGRYTRNYTRSRNGYSLRTRNGIHTLSLLGTLVTIRVRYLGQCRYSKMGRIKFGGVVFYQRYFKDGERR